MRDRSSANRRAVAALDTSMPLTIPPGVNAAIRLSRSLAPACHPHGMTKGTRATVTALAAFVGYRVCAEFMAYVPAIAIGLAAGYAVWLVSKPRES